MQAEKNKFTYALVNIATANVKTFRLNKKFDVFKKRSNLPDHRERYTRGRRK
jgi:hypothetical protein